MNGLRNLLKYKSIAKEAFDKTLIAGELLCFLHVTNTYVCTPTLGHGPSMLPTLNLTGDWILAEKISTRLGKVHNGDIVTARSPENPKKTIVKRIMGMEGDTVTYLVDPKNSEKSRTITVPKGHVWIQGDNIYSSNDSRHFGSIPYGLVQGKVFFRFWPVDGFGSLGPEV
ncbi:hypothetical protein MKW94_020565 [Papaver nudicaule]|uniref:Peptidase S26 domain-containing protein n=1 Tax=Papaver nudicaule TaxID=74823 RepID=A0AA42ASZ8_PAPNU|nr:hypothetical protein [Papaver nudicaule]